MISLNSHQFEKNCSPCIGLHCTLFCEKKKLNFFAPAEVNRNFLLLCRFYWCDKYPELFESWTWILTAMTTWCTLHEKRHNSARFSKYKKYCKSGSNTQHRTLSHLLGPIQLIDAIFVRETMKITNKFSLKCANKKKIQRNKKNKRVQKLKTSKQPQIVVAGAARLMTLTGSLDSSSAKWNTWKKEDEAHKQSKK